MTSPLMLWLSCIGSINHLFSFFITFFLNIVFLTFTHKTIRPRAEIITKSTQNERLDNFSYFSSSVVSNFHRETLYLAIFVVAWNVECLSASKIYQQHRLHAFVHRYDTQSNKSTNFSLNSFFLFFFIVSFVVDVVVYNNLFFSSSLHSV